jgi:hypothetical protein
MGNVSAAEYRCPRCGGLTEFDYSGGHSRKHVDARDSRSICPGPGPRDFRRNPPQRTICPACFQWWTPTKAGCFKKHSDVDGVECPGGGRPAIAFSGFGNEPGWAEILLDRWDDADAEAWAVRTDEEQAQHEAEEARQAAEAAVRREAGARSADRKPANGKVFNTDSEIASDARDSARTYTVMMNLRASGRLQGPSAQRLLSSTAEKWEQRRIFWEVRKRELERRKKSRDGSFEQKELAGAIEAIQRCQQIRDSVLYVRKQPNAASVGDNASSRPVEAVDHGFILAKLWRRLTRRP